MEAENFFSVTETNRYWAPTVCQAGTSCSSQPISYNHLTGPVWPSPFSPDGLGLEGWGNPPKAPGICNC